MSASLARRPALLPRYRRPGHHCWLDGERQQLLDFYRAARLPRSGFGALDRAGQLPPQARADTLLTARMTHCFAIAALEGIPAAEPLVEHGLAALNGPLHDAVYGGWYAADNDLGAQDKQAYVYAFVALAAASARLAGITDAGLLERAIATIERHYWSEQEGWLQESFSRDWRRAEAYRGGNSHMHAVEAFIVSYDVTDQPHWLERALRIVEGLIHREAATHVYQVLEHFDTHWQPWPDYHRDCPTDAFRPYGLTPGHAFEWSRLLLNLEQSLLRAGYAAPGWLLSDAKAPFETSCRHGWAADGAPGIVYTLDWDFQPKLRLRMHWTLAEASAAAAALGIRTGEAAYDDWYRRFWDYIASYLIDPHQGSWHHELDAEQRPSRVIWDNKADLYHAYQATLLPQLPLAPAIARAMLERNAAV